jgi:uncharacterized membrane protein YfcA
VTVGEAIAIAAAGAGAGTINTVVGSGTLITFPVLIGFGYAPVVANVSNTVGLVPGSVAGAYGYRPELEGQRRRAIALGIASTLGAFCGAVLLLALPSSAFKDIVPFFIAAGVVLVVVQPWLAARLQSRLTRRGTTVGRLAPLGVAVIAVYGGYFGAAQGILLLAVLGLSFAESLQRLNGLKNVLAGLTNLTAGIVFAIAAPVDWKVSALLAAGSACGGVFGARVGRRLPPAILRGLIVVIGIAAIVKLTT